MCVGRFLRDFPWKFQRQSISEMIRLKFIRESYGSNVWLFNPTPEFPSKRLFASLLNAEDSMSCRISSRLPTITRRIAMSGWMLDFLPW